MSSKQPEKSQAQLDHGELVKAMRDYVPPGYQALTTVRDEIGALELRGRLFRGDLQAFFLSPNGEITKCAKNLWASDHGEIAMRSGRLRDRRILIGDESMNLQATGLELDDSGYVSPFIQLMLKASKHFDLGAPAGRRVKKSVLVDWFAEQKLPDGSPISQRLAEYMATLCREPSAMRGGNKRSANL